MWRSDKLRRAMDGAGTGALLALCFGGCVLIGITLGERADRPTCPKLTNRIAQPYAPTELP